MFAGRTLVVIEFSTITAHLDKEDMSGKYSWTDVFVRQNGAWRMVVAHVTMVVKK